MSDAANHRRDPGHRAQRGTGHGDHVAEPGATPLLTSAESSSPTCPWETLFTRDVDTIVDELCAGEPRDFVAECRDHVRDNAYFIEDGRLAAKTIAAVVSLAGAPIDTCLESLETIVEESTADILAEGPLSPSEVELVDDPEDEAPPLPVLLSRRLGVRLDAALRVIPGLNALDFGERHVVYHCLVQGLSPSEYAERFRGDRHFAQQALQHAMGLAVAAS